MKLGIDVLLADARFRSPLIGKRVALLGHPASLTSQGIHTLEALHRLTDLTITAGFGPQHGMLGEKQDNMIETQDYIDPVYNIPIFSLYGEVRRPTEHMMKSFDILLIDLQDIGTRIYTYVTTLRYVLEAASQHQKTVWVLDRPNPIGRPVEGSLLQTGWESFVGAGPLPMRHGLTMGELAHWFVSHLKLNIDLKVIKMEGWDPQKGPGYGWPTQELSWVNPSPNAPTLNMARCFPGTVLLEGTHLSEGRGTTRSLEVFGAPGLDPLKILKTMQAMAPEWLIGAIFRPCYFEPTFHKHVGKICGGIQIHTDNSHYAHESFRPYRALALFLKAFRMTYPDFEIWRDFHYEYESSRLAIDLLNGGSGLRQWVEAKNSSPKEFDQMISIDERTWQSTCPSYYIY